MTNQVEPEGRTQRGGLEGRTQREDSKGGPEVPGPKPGSTGPVYRVQEGRYKRRPPQADARGKKENG